MKRGSSISATTRLTEPTSVTTHARGATAHTSCTTAARTWTGAATNAKSAFATACSMLRADSMIAPRAIATSSARRRRVIAADTVRAEALACGQTERAPDQPDTDDGDLHAAALSTLPATAAARSTCSR